MGVYGERRTKRPVIECHPRLTTQCRVVLANCLATVCKLEASLWQPTAYNVNLMLSWRIRNIILILLCIMYLCKISNQLHVREIVVLFDNSYQDIDIGENQRHHSWKSINV